jgi:glycosyltransferase involved in cell wall biosynthesis
MTSDQSCQGLIGRLEEMNAPPEEPVPDMPEVEVLLPIHNEAESIEQTLQEIYQVVSPCASMRFLLCEDGSSDGTQEILGRLAGTLPMRVFHGFERKGYSRAVIDGFRRVESPFVLFLDSDGQVDPMAFIPAYPLRERFDVIIGWRLHRADPWYRKLMSYTFRTTFGVLFSVPVHDPSCPFLLIRRSVLEAVADDLGVLKQGFWWEFVARVCAAGFRVTEIPVRHRTRMAGQTQVYRFRKIPGIAWSHLLGLFVIKLQLQESLRRQTDHDSLTNHDIGS